MTDDQWTRAAEERLLEAAIRLAPAQGWSGRLAKAAGEACGFSAGETELLLPRGPADRRRDALRSLEGEESGQARALAAERRRGARPDAVWARSTRCSPPGGAVPKGLRWFPLRRSNRTASASGWKPPPALRATSPR